MSRPSRPPSRPPSVDEADIRRSARLVIVSWAAGCLLAASAAGAVWAYVRDLQHDRQIESRNALIIASERLMSTLKDVETGQRGFIITGDEQYLQPYDRGLSLVPSRLAALAAEGGDDLPALVAARLRSAADAISTYRASGAAVAADAVKMGTGKALMDRIRELIIARQQRATETIDRLKGDRGVDAALRIASLLGLVLACGGLGYVALQRRRQQRASQALLHGVLENAPVGLGFLDPSMRIRHVNGGLAAMRPADRDIAPGLDLWSLFPALRERLAPQIQRLIESGEGLVETEFETVGDDEATPRSFFEASFYPLERSTVGVQAGVGMVLADVTARRLAERATKESEERFRSLVEASAAIIWTADATGAFVRPQPNWNRFTGQNVEQSLGWGRLDCVHPDDREDTRQAWVEARASRSPIALEHRLRRRDGEYRHMALSAAPVLEEDGRLREWVGSHTDITDRKDAELQLSAAKDAAEAANRAKSAFLANMSHELRTPLSAVIGYSEMLEEEMEDLGEAGMLADLGKIKSNARHLLGLINDVLDLSKIEANRMDTFAETIDVAAFVRDVGATVETLVRQKANVLDLDLGEGLGAMRSDAVKLRQVLFNLLGNAAKFTENGRITLRVHRETAPQGDWLVFAIADTGIGMSAEQLARLFQRFTQADETTTRRFGGTGLGLAISRAFSQLLGGEITVTSQEGAGTCFTMRVPAAMPERRVEEDIPAALDAPEVLGQRELVLVIDDEASQRDLMARFLERQRFDVRTAPDGRTGLDLARALKPRAILLDVMMPQMDGWSVLTALKADPELARIPVVMVTFVAETDLGSTLGAADHVAKPIDWARLKHITDQFRDTAGAVLVVDDDADIRYRLKSVLEKNGWTVQEAADGAEALERVRHAPPHLILLDLTMPVMDGFAFLDTLRATPGCADIPVVVLSARDIGPTERDRLAGADRILRKDETSMRELTAEIRALEARQGADGATTVLPRG